MKKSRMFLFAIIAALALMLPLLLNASSVSAASAGRDISACSYANAWCVCSVYHSISGHDNVSWYGYLSGYSTYNSEGRYYGAGWTYYQLWVSGSQRMDIFTVDSWGDVQIGNCGQNS
jgi:hypothetical protein